MRRTVRLAQFDGQGEVGMITFMPRSTRRRIGAGHAKPVSCAVALSLVAAGCTSTGSPKPTEADQVWSTVKLTSALTQVELDRSDDADSTSVRGYFLGADRLRRGAKHLVHAPRTSWADQTPRGGVAGERALARGAVVGNPNCGFVILKVLPENDHLSLADLDAVQTRQVRTGQLALFDLTLLCAKHG